MSERLTGACTLASEIPSEVELRISPPLQVAAEVQAPPLPVTTSRPLGLELPLSTMPFDAPLDAMLRNVMSLSWIATLARLSALPVPVSIVLPVPSTEIVPALTAAKPAPLVASMSRPPFVKDSTEPAALLVSETAVAALPLIP